MHCQSGLANALSNCLHGKGFPGVGTIPESELLAKLINILPWKLKKNVYIKGSAKGAYYRTIFDQARRQGDFIGLEPYLYPFDFGIYARYEKDLKRKLTREFP